MVCVSFLIARSSPCHCVKCLPPYYEEPQPQLSLQGGRAPFCHCEESTHPLNVIARSPYFGRRSNPRYLEIPHVPSTSLRGGAHFAPTRQSLVVGNHTTPPSVIARSARGTTKQSLVPKVYWGAQKRDCHGSQNEPRNDNTEGSQIATGYYRGPRNDKEGRRPHNDKKEDTFLFANEKIGFAIILFPVL